MARLVWDAEAERRYETGVKKGVLYVKNSDGTYGDGVVWDGLSSVQETPSGADANPIYADDIKWLNLIAAEEFGATIEAYMYPEEFKECDGSKQLAPGVSVGQQIRKKFGFAFVTTVGNATLGEAYGYKIHLIYNCTAAPSDRQYQTINESPEALSFSYEISTEPTEVGEGFKPTSNIIIDSTKVDATKLKAFEDILWGKDGEGSEAKTAKLPTPAEVYAHFKVSA